jgi:ubiquinone/menaquinone biosynthesis C-methylase UbiE
MQEPLTDLKRLQRAAWSSAAGYHQLTQGFGPAVEDLLDWVGISPGDSVLDVATGSGRAALAARRRGAQVTGIDFSLVQLSEAEYHAARAGFDDIQLDEGDFEALPYPDHHFSAVISTFGVLHAARAETAAGELERVLAYGGQLGIATWAPECGLLTLHRLLYPYRPTSPLVADPREWGNRGRIRELFSRRVLPKLEHREGELVLVYINAETAWHAWRSRYGPIRSIYMTLNAERQAQLDRAALDFFRASALADGRIAWRLGYLLTRASKVSTVSRLG